MASASRGHVAWALQASKYGDAAFDPLTLTWKKHNILAGDLGTQEMRDALPYEVGGGMFLNGTYKNGFFFGGTFAVEARLAGSLGWLLHGLGGEIIETAAGSGASPKTRFRVDPTNATNIPWLAFRKYIPDDAGTGGVTEYGADCRISAMTLTLPQMGPLRAEIAVVGRKAIMVDSEDDDGDTIEDSSSLAMAGVVGSSVSLSSFASYLPGATATGGKFTGAQIILTNQYTTPQQEMIIGSQYPDNFTVVARNAMVRLIYKWSDDALYKYLQWGAPSGGQSLVNSTVFTSPIAITAASAANIPTFNNPYKLVFGSDTVEWTMSSPTLAPQQQIQVELIGQIVQPTGATPAWWIDLHNAKTDYLP